MIEYYYISVSLSMVYGMKSKRPNEEALEETREIQDGLKMLRPLIVALIAVCFRREGDERCQISDV
jgi:hypothetical protein